jgi:uncharacterized membrane protein
MVLLSSILTVAVIVLFIVNARNQSGIVSLKKEVIQIKKQLKQMQQDQTQQDQTQQDQMQQDQTQQSMQESMQKSMKKAAEAVTSMFEEPIGAEPTQVEPRVTEPMLVEPVLTDVTNNQTATVISAEDKKPTAKSTLFSIESIISKLGIFLFLVGIGYLYKLAYDNGYITEALATVFGEVLGIGILGLGSYVQRKQRHILSQVLFGGGIATLFIVTFVAYNNYYLISGFTAMFIFVMVTIIAFYIALSINSKTIAVVAILGGLLTPFMVDIEYLGFFGVGIYLLILSVGAMSMYLFKRWRTLQLSTIIGVYFVTLILLTNGTFNEKESVQFSLLLLALFLLFNGLDYVLFYREFETMRFPMITPILFITIPVITVLHWVEVLDLSNNQWSILFFSCTLVYILAYVMLVKKRGHLLVSDIIISFVGIFALIAVILYFGGDVRIIAIIILSSLFYVLSLKTGNKYINIIGHCVFTCGFFWALFELLDSFESGFSILSLSVQFIVLLIMVGGALLQKGLIKKIQGTVVLEVYGLAVIFRLTSELGKNSEPIIVIMLTLGIFVWVLWALNQKLQLVSIISITVLGIAPFLAQIITNAIYAYEDTVPTAVIILSVLYCINLYSIAVVMFRNAKPTLALSFKITAYTMFIVNTLVHLTIITHHFGYGLSLIGVFILFLYVVEKQRGKVMNVFLTLLGAGFIVLLVLYGVTRSGDGTLDYLVFVNDVVALIILYFILKKLTTKDILQFILHIFCYLLLIYQNLKEIDNGTITLLWAAYGIITLFIHVYLKKRIKSYISLALIIFVAIKFIFIDLSSVEPVFKVVTSMVFGIALLVLSYFIQPLLVTEKDQ